MYYEEYEKRMAAAKTWEERESIQWIFDNCGSAWERMPPILRYGVAVLATIYFGGAMIAPLFWIIR